MSKHVAAGLYVAAWLLALASLSYVSLEAGGPWWFGAGVAYVLFVLINGTIAYREQSRRAAEQGLPIPAYLSYLVSARAVCPTFTFRGWSAS